MPPRKPFDPQRFRSRRASGPLGAALERMRAVLARPAREPRRLKVGYNTAGVLIERAEQAALRRKRKPPEAGLSVPAIPPKGPLPKQGGAAAPLDLEAD
ncbi:MAG: hypothetical protein AAFY81_02695 [Pseudomonadota bacterium]